MGIRNHILFGFLILSLSSCNGQKENTDSSKPIAPETHSETSTPHAASSSDPIVSGPMERIEALKAVCNWLKENHLKLNQDYTENGEWCGITSEGKSQCHQVTFSGKCDGSENDGLTITLISSMNEWRRTRSVPSCSEGVSDGGSVEVKIGPQQDSQDGHVRIDYEYSSAYWSGWACEASKSIDSVNSKTMLIQSAATSSGQLKIAFITTVTRRKYSRHNKNLPEEKTFEEADVAVSILFDVRPLRISFWSERLRNFNINNINP